MINKNPDSQDMYLVTSLIIKKLSKLVDYISCLEPDLEASELAAIVAFLIDGLPQVIKSCQLEENIHRMAVSLKNRRQQSSATTNNQ
ncbi:MAG: hypothetical protein V7K89_09430 [Nostoc sp.]|uniref:hypothetical protein n=1 Tax=Nostoc sp. TaxID=1180 RepID=UPI002FF99B8F